MIQYIIEKSGVVGILSIHQISPAASSQPLMVRLNASDTPSSAQLSIEWTPPTSPNGVILYYRVTWDAMTENTTDDTPGHVITGLTPFTNYTITVAAVNGAGIGNSSESVVLQTEESSE